MSFLVAPPASPKAKPTRLQAPEAQLMAGRPKIAGYFSLSYKVNWIHGFVKRGTRKGSAYRNEIITENSLRLKSVSKCEANEA